MFKILDFWKDIKLTGSTDYQEMENKHEIQVDILR